MAKTAVFGHFLTKMAKKPLLDSLFWPFLVKWPKEQINALLTHFLTEMDQKALPSKGLLVKTSLWSVLTKNLPNLNPGVPGT